MLQTVTTMKHIRTTSGLLSSEKVFSQHALRRNTTVASEQPKPFKSIPGLSTLPIIGPLHHFLPVIGTVKTDNFQSLATDLYKKFGPVVKLEGILARATLLLLFEPEHFDQIYRSEDERYALRPGFESSVYYRTVLRKSTYDGVYGLTTAQGPQWRDFRTKVNPAFLKPKLVKLYEPAFDNIAKEVVERIMRLKDDKDYLKNNFNEEITKWSLESIAFVGLGTRLGCLDDSTTEDHPARQLIKCAKDIMELSYKLEFMPNPWKYIATPSYKKLIKTLDLQWKLSKKFIDEAKRQIEERDHDVPDEDKSIIEKLIAVDEKVALMMANEMLMAGIDTVAHVTTAALYQLALNPDKQEKLREEIRSKVPQRRYLKACVRETLRLFPVVPSNLRRTTKTHIVAGYEIPEGVDVIAPHEFLSRLEKYYPRPSEFIPERWVAEKSDPLYYGHINPLATQPFGYGIRTCIGRRLAELEVETFLARLINDLNVTWDGPLLKIQTRVMNGFVKPYHFKFEVAK